MTRVVVTGLGVVAGPLTGADQIAEALRRGVPPASEVDRSAGYHLSSSSRLAIVGRAADLAPWLSSAEARRMSPPSKLGVAAARMAIKDAAFAQGIDDQRTTVVLSSAYSAVQYTEQLLRTVFKDGPEVVSPFLFAESVANAAAAQIAIATGAKGRNATITQREAGILSAVGRGAAEVASGRADVALVGGVEEMPPLLHAMLDRFESLARPDGAGGEVARPFDRHRNGFMAAEGAVVLVLEEESRARARGATIRAVIRGFAGAFDPTAPRIGWGRGHVTLARSLRRMLDHAEILPRDVSRIVSGASGAIAGDRLEAGTLREAWDGSSLPPVLAPKGVLGQYGGGFLAAAVLAATDPQPAATAGFRERDPELDLAPHDGSPIVATGPTVVTSIGSGGSASWLLLEGPA